MFRCALGFCVGRCPVVNLVNVCGLCLDFAGYFVVVVVVGFDRWWTDVDVDVVMLIVLFRRYIGCRLCDYICLLISMF